MNALLLIAHGSRRNVSNKEVLGLADDLARLAGNKFDLVKACFLELAEPGIDEAISVCAQQEIQNITVLPYFLSAGRHVVEDVPQELAKSSRKYPDLSISVCTHVGALDAMPTLLLNTALSQDDQAVCDLASPLELNRENTHGR